MRLSVIAYTEVEDVHWGPSCVTAGDELLYVVVPDMFCDGLMHPSLSCSVVLMCFPLCLLKTVRARCHVRFVLV